MSRLASKQPPEINAQPPDFTSLKSSVNSGELHRPLPFKQLPLPFPLPSPSSPALFPNHLQLTSDLETFLHPLPLSKSVTFNHARFNFSTGLDFLPSRAGGHGPHSLPGAAGALLGPKNTPRGGERTQNSRRPF